MNNIESNQEVTKDTEGQSSLNAGLGDELPPKVKILKGLFEEWLPKQVGAHVKKEFANFDNEDGYHDQIINAMWIGFCAGSVIHG